MSRLSVDACRADPYKDFKFRVKWAGRYVAGVSKIGALERVERTMINPASEVLHD